MTYEEAVSLRHFKYCCACGGYAWHMNGRKEASPHMSWCPQMEEYQEWYKAIHSKDNKEVYHE